MNGTIGGITRVKNQQTVGEYLVTIENVTEAFIIGVIKWLAAWGYSSLKLTEDQWEIILDGFKEEAPALDLFTVIAVFQIENV